MLEKNAGLSSDELEINTVYYLENIVRGYILKNRYKIRTTSQIKNKILIILNQGVSTCTHQLKKTL